MMQQVFAVRDIKADAYLPPFFCLTVGQARRMLEDAVKDKEHVFSKHPGDYQLYFVGSWDEASGLLAGFPDSPKYVGVGTDYEVLGGIR